MSSQSIGEGISKSTRVTKIQCIKNNVLELQIKSNPSNNVKTNTLSCACEKQVLEKEKKELESFWSLLPEELIDRILLCLPVATKVQFRSVCRKWKCLLQSDTYYRSKYQINPVREPWFLLCTSGKFSCAFDFEMKKWYRLPNPPIPHSSILGAAGSILCLGNLVADCKVLSLCNPMKKVLKQLPPMLRVELIHKISIALYKENGDTPYYKIMVAGEQSVMSPMMLNSRVYRLYTEIYDSKDGYWTMGGNPLPHEKFGCDPGVWCNGCFYCITEMPYGVVIFDPNHNGGTWSKLAAPTPCSIASPSLVECKGHLILVGRVTIHNSNSLGEETIQIWKLQSSDFDGTNAFTWTQVQHMPPSIYSEFTSPLKLSYAPLICCAVGECLCISTHLSPRPVAFSFSHNTWEWLSGDPLFPGNRNFHLLGFCFDPIGECLL